MTPRATGSRPQVCILPLCSSCFADLGAISRATPNGQIGPEGPSTGHTCHGDWLNSGRLTVDETSSLKKAKSSYSEAESAVHKAKEAFFTEDPGAQDALNSAHESLFTAFENEDDLLESLREKYPHCFTCKVGLSTKETAMLTMQNDAIRASEHEERFPPSLEPSQESRRIQ